MKTVARAAAILLLVALVAVVALGGYAMWMPERSHEGPLPELTEEQAELRDRLRAHVEMLAGEIGPRHARRPDNYRRAADYIVEALEDAGYEPSIREFEHAGQTFRNIEAAKPGRRAPDEIVVVGAHYDTAGPTPGADDNASGVAGVLELARAMADDELDRTVRFVFFANEEAPYYRTEAMGSRVYAKRARQRDESIQVMMSLEMLGYYSTEPGSQEYPALLSLVYPDRGDFIGFVGNLAYREAVTRSIGAFRRHAAFPSEGLSAPTFVPGVSLSDHWAFWQEDYPALMVTDTAFFRNPHYHLRSDTPDTLDYERFARVVDGLRAVVEAWARPG